MLFWEDEFLLLNYSYLFITCDGFLSIQIKYFVFIISELLTEYLQIEF